MIYSQSLLFYLMAAVATLLCFRALNEFLEQYFDTKFALLVSLTVLLHPLSIEAFVAPNPIRGPIAFGLFLHGLNSLKVKTLLGIFFFLMATACNIGYGLFPVYFTILYRKELKNHLFPLIVYLVMFLWYGYKLLVNTVHSPVNFISNMLIDAAAPLYISFFDFTILDWYSIPNLLIVLFCIALLVILTKRNKKTLFFIPMILFPICGNVLQQWVEPYKFWDEFVLKSSNFLVLVFGVVLIIAINIPRRFFIAYSLSILLLSANWAKMWFPQSEVIKESIIDLPAEFPQTLNAKRLLVWQLFYEKKIKEGTLLLNTLAKEYPENEDLKRDLELLKRGVF